MHSVCGYEKVGATLQSIIDGARPVGVVENYLDGA